MNLQDEIDIAFAKVVDELREKHATSVENFAGQVTGVLLATAIKLAKEGGCPRGVLEWNVGARIEEEYAR